MEDFELVWTGDRCAVRWGGRTVSEHATWPEALVAATGGLRQSRRPPHGRRAPLA